MLTFSHLLAMYDSALTDCDAHVARAASADLGLRTPCEQWDLGALLGHLIGQHDGFATAVRDGDAPLSEFTAVRLGPADIDTRWAESVSNIRDAFGTAKPDAPVRLRELGTEVDVTTALGMQLVDAAVHTWDVAASLRQPYRPAAGIVEAVYTSAEMIAARPGGMPGIFALPQRVTGEDTWADALRLLGRNPAAADMDGRF